MRTGVPTCSDASCRPRRLPRALPHPDPLAGLPGGQNSHSFLPGRPRNEGSAPAPLLWSGQGEGCPVLTHWRTRAPPNTVKTSAEPSPREARSARWRGPRRLTGGGGCFVPDAQQGSPWVPEFCSVSRGWRRPPPQPPGAAVVTGRGASWPEPARPGLLFYFPGQHSNTGLETRVREAASPPEAPGASAASTPPASPGARAPRPAGEAPASAPASHPLVALTFPPPL